MNIERCGDTPFHLIISMVVIGSALIAICILELVGRKLE